MDFSNITGKKISSCFVPADQMSITFVMEDGFRRSLGVKNSGGTRIKLTGHTIPPGAEMATLTAVTVGDNLVRFVTTGGDIEIGFTAPASLVELPE
jgi:hypothetical protein